MAKVTVLFLEDKLVGPHMELLRNICDPSSLSKPHVTVRYSDELVAPAADFNLRIRYIDLVEARAFGLSNHESRARFTVYIKAASDQLEFLHYKQGYPDSEFHITAYNGPTRQFAEHLLVILRKFDWHLRVHLPRGTRLVEIPVRPERLKKATAPRQFDPAVRRLFKKLTSLEMTWPLVRDMTDVIRLELAEQICSHLTSRAGDIRNHVRHAADSYSDDVVSELRENGPKPEIYLTPPELARDISRLALKYHKRKDPIKFGDPAVGTGAFYAAILETAGTHTIESAIGIDINRDNLLVAKKKWGRKGLHVKHADFLHLEELSPRSLILANPPYLRQQRIDPAYKWKLRERASVKTQTVVSGLSGLYVYFILLCDAWMAKGCVAAWLIPSEFMQTDYGAAIRKYLTEKVELLRIHTFDEKRPRFEAVQVFPSVVVFRKGPPKKSGLVSVTEGGSLLFPESSQTIRVGDLPSQEKWRFLTKEIQVESTTDLRIGDIFDIRRGIATGANDFFVLSSERVAELGIPSEALKPLLPKAHLIKSDIVGSNGTGEPDVSPQLYLLDVDLDEQEINQKYPALKAYLDTAEKKGVRSRTLVRSRKSWYKQEVREPAPYLCTYMGREKISGPPLRFIWNRSKAVVTNTYLMLYPKVGVRKAIETDSPKAKELFEILKDSAEHTMREKWRMHAGGLRKIEPRELADVRLLREPRWLTEVIEPHLR